MKERKFALIPMLLLVASLLTGFAFASDASCAVNGKTNSTSVDSAWNAFSDEIALSERAFDGDIYWVGSDLTMQSCDTLGDMLLAGRDLSVTDSLVGGSLRTGGYQVNISGTDINNNITSAGYSVVAEDVSARGVYIMANTASFDGDCSYLSIGGNTVKVSGTVDGDADLSGTNIILDSDLVITGHTEIHSSKAPQIPAGVTDYELFIDEQAAVADKPFSFGGWLLERLYWMAALAIVALLLCLVGDKALKGSGQMLLERPVAMSVTGLITLAAVPVSLIILCVTAIGAPTAGLLGGTYGMMCFFSVAFAGASAARIIFKNMHPVLASVIGAAVLALLRGIPYLGGLILLASIIYIGGYVVLVCYENIKALKKQPQDGENLPAAQDGESLPAAQENPEDASNS